jgi:hypothetical protein
MTIDTPTTIEQPIFSGDLESREERLRGETTKAEIGRPEWWFLSDVAGNDFKPPQGSETYLLLRFSYSLSPPRGQTVEDAQFGATLTCNDPGLEPVAFDLFPREVLDESKTDLKIKVGPSLKMEEAELSAGSIEAHIRIPKVEPVVTTSGIGKSSPVWNFRRHRRHPLLGSRIVYAIVAYPTAAKQMTVRMDLKANVRTPFGLWLFYMPSAAAAQLSRQVP